MTAKAEGIWELQKLVREAIAADIWNRKYTQLALSSATGLSQSHISNILSGTRRTNFRNLDELANAAGLRIIATIDQTSQPAPNTRSPRFAELGEQIEAEERAARRANRRRLRRP